jgi:Ribonuclease G/E
VKDSILRSFEALIKGLDPALEEPEPPPEPPKPAPRPKPRVVVEEGVFLGRAWRRYADGGVEGETVRGMEAFRDLESFRSFVEGSPLLRTERSGGIWKKRRPSRSSLRK